MKLVHRRSAVALACAAVLLAAPSAIAQTVPDADAFRLYGGSWVADCADASSPRLSVLAGSLVFSHGDVRITGANALAAPDPFGARPPAHVRAALVGQAEGGAQLRFVVYRDASGEYIQVDGDPAVLNAIGRTAQGLQFRRCTTTTPGGTTFTPAGRPARTTAGAAAMIGERRFRVAWHRALGFRVRESWLADLDGPSPPARSVRVGREEYVLVAACKNHDCGERNLVLLWSPARNVVYGKIYQAGVTTLVGAPPPAVATELEALWKAEWRRTE